MDKKYDLKDSSIEDQKAFKQGLEELLLKEAEEMFEEANK